MAASAEIQAAARRVVDENKRLRQLLRQHGLSDLEIGTLSGEDTAAALDGMLEARRSCNSNAGGGCRTSGSVSSSMGSPAPAPSPLPDYATSPQQQLQPRPPQLQSLYPSQHLTGPQAYSPGLNVNSHQPTWPPEMYAHASRTAQLGVDYTQYPSPPKAISASMNPYEDHNSYNQTPQQHYQIPPYTQQQAIPQDQHLGWLQNYPTAEFLKGVPHPHLQPNLPSTNPTPTSSSCKSAAETLRVFKPDAGFELEAEMGCKRCAEPGEGCTVESQEVFRLVDKYTGGFSGS